MAKNTSVFSVTVTNDQNWKKPHYPSYEISRMNVGSATSLQKAEELIHNIVSRKEESMSYMLIENIHHFNVREIPLDKLCLADGCLSEWLYDKRGNLIDSRTISSMRNRPGLFTGRTEDQYRFHEGDIVEVEEGNEIHLGFVVALPPSVERALKINTGTPFHLDDTDDSYTVLTDSDYRSHDHVDSLKLHRPQFKIHPSIENKLRNAYAEYLTSDMRWRIVVTTVNTKLKELLEGIDADYELGPTFIEQVVVVLKDLPEKGKDTTLIIDYDCAFNHFDRVSVTICRLYGRNVKGKGYALKKEISNVSATGERTFHIRSGRNSQDGIIKTISGKRISKNTQEK